MSSSVMGQFIEPTFLKEKNPHERDARIHFDEEPHIYTIDGSSDFTSVTTWVHSHFSHFDADKIIDKMMKGRNWKPGHKYWGMTKQEIKDMWAANGKEASDSGTIMHYDIECFYNEIYNENTSVEFQYFKNFYDKYKDDLIPYRTEWRVFDTELKFAGSIDMMFEDKEGNLLIYDWKRCKEIPKNNPYGKFSHNPIIEHFPDCKFFHYSLQLNVYKALVEKNYGRKVKEMCLICLHPNFDNYVKLVVPDLQKEVLELFEERRQQVAAAKE